MTYMGVNFIHMWFNTEHHNWRWVHYITYFIFLATQISYFAPQQCYGEVHETHLEGIFQIYSGSLLRHSVAVIATCSPPPRCDLASCRTTLPCAIRPPFDFKSWMSASGDAKPKCLSILAAPPVFEETRGGAVPFWTRTEFSSAQLFLLESHGLVTSHQFFLI